MIVFWGWRWKTGGFIKERVLVCDRETKVGRVFGEVGFVEEKVAVLI